MKKIAVSKAKFAEMIKYNFIYVDKTKYLYKIVNSYEPYYFLARPRRFGKSLFISTLEAFFQGKKELFQNLYVYEQEWDWQEYPIIKLDFNEMENSSPVILENRVEEIIESIARENSIELEWKTSSAKFNELVKKLAKKCNKGVVILIDEYDKPIISHLGLGEKELKIAKANMDFMKVFYDNLKPLEEYIRLVFITGISKFSKVSIFSTLNNLIELDNHPEFSAILGYTEKELRMYFSDYVIEFADKLNITEEELFAKIKTMYDGFRFSKEDIKVYNPYSVGKALNYREIDNYWFESGTTTFLVNLIKEKEFNISKLDNIEVGKDEIKAYNLEKLQLIPLLFQTGYLTIKDIEDNIIYTLGFPNNEVETGFNVNYPHLNPKGF